MVYDGGIVFNANTHQYLIVFEPFNSSGGRRAFAQEINDRNRVIDKGCSDAVLTNQSPRQGFWHDVSPTQDLSSYKNQALLWLPEVNVASGNKAFDLNDLVSLGSVLTGGWTKLLEARSINENG